jgi:beta-ribofuranosylaminobenzene 5'-phosphate synthase
MPVVVTTASRLHFGLLRFEQPSERSYGGLGVMINNPRWRIELTPADQWSLTKPSEPGRRNPGARPSEAASRALELACQVLDRLNAPHKPHALHLTIHESIPPHRGFGGGTQLALALAAGTRALLGLPRATAEELATLTGRGRRSAVGAHGFLHGGLLWEIGRLAHEPLGQLAKRIALPESWRVVLIDPGDRSGLSGAHELTAFEQLPPVAPHVTEELERIAEQQILPAAVRGDFKSFSEAIHDYGRTAGQCFAPVQGGPYASDAIARTIAAIREFGVKGAGQSSWGPTVFAIAEDERQADVLCANLAKHKATREFATQVTAPANHGATIIHLAPGH